MEEPEPNRNVSREEKLMELARKDPREETITELRRMLGYIDVEIERQKKHRRGMKFTRRQEKRLGENP